MGNSMVRRISRSVGLALLALFVTAGAAFAQTGRLEGVVENGATGDAVSGARITIERLNLSAVTGADGSYSIDNVPAGQYRIQAQIIGFQVVILTAQNIRGGPPTIVNFDLQPSVLRLDGVVVRSSSQVR